MNQRCPLTPLPAPVMEYVYQAKYSTGAFGLTSTMKPCPDVDGLYQLPESAKSALVGRAVVVEHVTLGVSRVSNQFQRVRCHR